MSAQIAAYGRLAADPRPIETRSGKAMTAARLAVSVECRDGGGARPARRRSGCPCSPSGAWPKTWPGARRASR